MLYNKYHIFEQGNFLKRLLTYFKGPIILKSGMACLELYPLSEEQLQKLIVHVTHYIGGQLKLRRQDPLKKDCKDDCWLCIE